MNATAPHATIPPAGRGNVAHDALAAVQVEPESKHQRRRRKRYGDEPRASRPYVRKARGLWGQKLASQPASPWLGNLSGGELIIVRQAVRRGSVPLEIRPTIVAAVARTMYSARFRKFLSVAYTFLAMDKANIAATRSLKD